MYLPPRSSFSSLILSSIILAIRIRRFHFRASLAQFPLCWLGNKPRHFASPPIAALETIQVNGSHLLRHFLPRQVARPEFAYERYRRCPRIHQVFFQYPALPPGSWIPNVQLAAIHLLTTLGAIFRLFAVQSYALFFLQRYFVLNLFSRNPPTSNPQTSAIHARTNSTNSGCGRSTVLFSSG